MSNHFFTARRAPVCRGWRPVATLGILLAALGPAWAGNTNRTAADLFKLDRPAANEPTIVTSDRLQADYLSNTGTFEGNVLVVDPRISVRADKMVVTFSGEGTNATERSVQRIEATGGVVITQEDRKATSDKAVYTADDGKVVLTGHPRVQTSQGTVTGERITFWRDEQRMDVESGTQLILYPEQFKKDAEEREQQQKKKGSAATPAAAETATPTPPAP